MRGSDQQERPGCGDGSWVSLSQQGDPVFSVGLTEPRTLPDTGLEKS